MKCRGENTSAYEDWFTDDDRSEIDGRAD
jgi:hypothetical protein